MSASFRKDKNYANGAGVIPNDCVQYQRTEKEALLFAGKACGKGRGFD